VSSSLIAVVGPTASGKSALAIQIAKSLGACEIISADAMQLYRGMDIGTAKLSPSEQEGIPHHLIDAVEPTEEVTAVQYRELFDEALSAIGKSGKTPIVAGGSTLYLAAALDEMQFAPTDPMHALLESKDPAAAVKIPASNLRRVIRALEVVEISGKSFAASLPDPAYRRPTTQIGILVERELLRERIEQRVRGMWEVGLVVEVEGLLARYPNLSKTARVAIGYQQAAAQLSGELTEDQAIAETVQLTQRYAKKQMTWFRRDSRIVWLDSSKDLLGAAMDVIRL
jgi:tRNA dimethylallyltransferase